jgi:hypothetical protein
MNKKTRTILFLICFLIFILVTPLAVLYSQGYRLDFNPSEGWIRISQAGGLFLKVTPRQVDVYVDDKLIKRTDFFFGSILVENLLPKKHKITVKKQDYHNWEKTLEIKEKQVVEIKNIILFPEQINVNLLSDKTEKIWLSLDQKKIISLEKEEQTWALKSYDLTRNIKSHLLDQADLAKQETEIINLIFSQDSKTVELEVGFKNNLNQEIYIKKFILEIDKEKPGLTEKTMSNDLAENIENIVCYKIINNDLYYLDNSGYLFKNQEKLNQTSFPIEEKQYSLEIFQEFIFLQEDETVYQFNSDQKNFEIFFEKINFFKISPDRNKLTFFSDYEIWLFFLKDDFGPPERKINQKLLLTRISDQIKDVSWLNDHYLIFIADNQIKVAEIDDRDKVNVVNLLNLETINQSGNFIKTAFSLFDKKIYFLLENNNQTSLYSSSETLIP